MIKIVIDILNSFTTQNLIEKYNENIEIKSNRFLD